MGRCLVASTALLAIVLAVFMSMDYSTLGRMMRAVEKFAYQEFRKLNEHIKDMHGGEERQRFFDRNDFPLVKDFESHYLDIRREVIDVMQNVQTPQFDEVVLGQDVLNEDHKWSVFQLRVYNRDLEFNHVLAPITAGLVRKYSEISYAMFSILDGPKYIPPHEGLYSGVLRVHLPLIVPQECKPAGTKPQCYIQVMNETAFWEEGKGMVFDDSLGHFVEFEVAKKRVVLFLDIRRPLPFYEDLLNRIFLTYTRFIPLVDGVVQKARKFTMAK
ncbi:hypothetical protein AAMO2058_001068400 [Amorphochlora amoebiformis]